MSPKIIGSPDGIRPRPDSCRPLERRHPVKITVFHLFYDKLIFDIMSKSLFQEPKRAVRKVGQAFQPDSDRPGPRPTTAGVRLESLTYAGPAWISSLREHALVLVAKSDEFDRSLSYPRPQSGPR
jgi:hypothetical protein